MRILPKLQIMTPRIIKAVLLCVLSVHLVDVSAQVAAVRLTVNIPNINSSDKGVFISGSFNHWQAGDSLYRMNKIDENTYSITLPVFDGHQYQYKYTLGSWDRVEVASNDSDIHNRFFLSSNGKAVTDTVIKWRQPKSQATNATNPQMQQIMAMKDSAVARLQPGLNNMLQLLQSYVQNLVKETPSEKIHRRLDKKAMKNIGTAYKEVTKLLWNIFATLSPEQKQKIAAAINQPAGSNNNFLNVFFGALNNALSENKPAS